jgi:hypothetical protein
MHALCMKAKAPEVNPPGLAYWPEPAPNRHTPKGLPAKEVVKGPASDPLTGAGQTV